MVVHGEPDPIQRGSGVSVPVASDATPPPGVAESAVLVLQGGKLVRRTTTTVTDVALPAGLTPVSIRQVAPTASAVLATGPGGGQALLVTSIGSVVQLGAAERLAAGADSTSVVIQSGGSVIRYGFDGGEMGEAVALPNGQQLIGDSLAGYLSSTQVDLIDVGDPTSVSSTPNIAVPTVDAVGSPLPASAVFRNGSWFPLSRLIPIGSVGGSPDELLLWSPQLRRPIVYDLTVPPTLPAQAVGNQLLPVRFLPGVPGVLLTGPIAMSPDGTMFAVAGRVGVRPRIVVGRVTAGEDDPLNVISIGGEVIPGIAQAAPLWEAGVLEMVNPLGEFPDVSAG